MEAVKIILGIVFTIICVVITVIVLMQEGKQAGLSGGMSGMSDSYWSKNKSRSAEGKLEKATTILAVLFIVLSIVANLGYFA